MADQVTSGTVQGAAGEPSGLDPRQAGAAALATATTPATHEAFHGRPVSWVAVSIIIAGFVIGGAALVAGPTWWLFWAGVGVAGVGGILAMATGVFNDWY